MEVNNTTRGEYVTYKIRWFMLAVVMMFNISNAMIWITYASIVNDAAVYYEVSETRINWFSLVFFVFSVIAGLPSFWLIDTYGLRAGILTGTWINGIGCVIRLLPSFVFGVKTRFWVALVGQVIAACSQPIILSIPTKLAALWFADNERTLANTMASLSNPLGVLIASGLAPLIVNEPNQIKLLLVLFSLPALIAVLMATFGVCSSVPPTAPSSSAHEISKSFFVGVKETLRSRSFLLLTSVFGFGVAAFSTITSLLEQIICTKGYNNDIAGLCGALVIIGGLLFSGIAGVYVDKTKKFEETAKIFIMLAVIASCLILICSNLYDQTVLLCISFFLFGATALGVAPILLELGVECTYPVDEATSAGLQWLFGQLIGTFLMLGLPAMGRPLTAKEKEKSVCNIAGSQSIIQAKDLTNALILVSVMLTAIVLVFVFAFKADYKRLHAEIEAKAAKNFYVDPQELDQAADEFEHT